MKTLFNHSFFRFALVGASGFAVDVISMLLLSTWIPFIVARGIAFWIAATSNWWLNRNITFVYSHNKSLTSGYKKAAVLQWLQFIGGSFIAFIPNWSCYVVLLAVQPNITNQTLYELWPYLAMAPGVLMGMTINYVFSRFWIFSNTMK
ncbi:polysaccharide synthesis protein GtrA [Marinomonas ushuaiensis DSM 15871]|uniref:Polysaccharide synthesis protein GtrA n=1 Tax=Marinomonas ushuaiensis DSM 15871 TaxID=1122207 RepID=X7E1F1_9GAMM|nr:GtrA family protein [Marinomonas ushuaiensis]ETX09802.1 polysaccharide synthesis protein GtrA [Marinomonas ushuaiensis DSM 15871]